MRTVRLLPLLVLASCAPAAAPAAPSRSAAVQTVRIETSTGTSEARIEPTRPVAQSATVALPPARVWAALPAAYTALGLPAGRGDEAAGRWVAGPAQVTRALGGTRLSRYLDCGATVSTPNADAYAVTLTVDTRLAPAAGGATQVETRVQAHARPLETAGDRVPCTSTGGLERRLGEELGRATQ